MFTSEYSEVLKLIDQIDPIEYGKSRNYLNGAVTKLSPYISRGVISTKQIAHSVLSKGYQPYEIESFLKELAWRDYFQQVWIARGNDILFDLKHKQNPVNNHLISSNIVSARTSIEAVDHGIRQLYETGYIHNHLRMYVASLCCNIAHSHWFKPAQWMYYHLLDADWASNALSWQWVAGSFSQKKYFANQENINKYCNTNQKNTFLDIPYEDFNEIVIPEILKSTHELELQTILPNPDDLIIDPNLPIYVFNFYNLDPTWSTESANNVLLLEPSFFEKYPVSEKTIDFIIALSKNITGIQIVVGEFDTVFDAQFFKQIHFKEHPTVSHYKGNKHSRNWMFESVKGYFPSFFAYWKNCVKKGFDELY